MRCQYGLELARLSHPYWLTKQVAAQVQQMEADGLGQSLEEAAETLQH